MGRNWRFDHVVNTCNVAVESLISNCTTIWIRQKQGSHLKEIYDNLVEI